MPELPVSRLFPLLFMMMGPLRVIPTFAGLTAKLDAPTRSRISVSAVVYADIGVLLSVFVGVGLLQAWNVSRAALATSTGTLLFVTV